MRSRALTSIMQLPVPSTGGVNFHPQLPLVSSIKTNMNNYLLLRATKKISSKLMGMIQRRIITSMNVSQTLDLSWKRKTEAQILKIQWSLTALTLGVPWLILKTLAQKCTRKIMYRQMSALKSILSTTIGLMTLKFLAMLQKIH